MVQPFVSKDFSKEEKILLLRELGYGSDGVFVLKGNERHKDKYTGEDVKVNNMVIYPGSLTIVNNDEISIANLLEEYGDNVE